MPLELNIETRTRTGSREARRIRREGLVPGILYGRGGEVPVSVNAHHFMTTVGYNSSLGIIRLNIPGEKPVNCIVKEVQWNPINDRPVHIDFLRVLPTQMITVPVPLHLEGSPKGILQGGILDHMLHEISVTVKASEIPQNIAVDVSGLELGDALHVSDIVLPAGMTIEMSGEQVVASVIAPRVMKSSSDTEATEGEAPEAGEGK
jgi:large subunit ribosomal protein L25